MREYQEVLHQEKLMWYQRSREDWIVSGDRNTAYYHAATSVKKAQNMITSLRDENDEWVSDSARLQDFVREYYIQLFSNEPGAQTTSVLEGAFPTLTLEDWREFNLGITKEEVHKTLFEMAPFKAPGPDGFHAAFYQHMWNTVGDKLYELVMMDYGNGRLPQGLNDTLLVLIPKVAHPETVK